MDGGHWQGYGATNKAPGAPYTPKPQVVYKGQRLRIQQNQKSKVLDHALSKDKNTTNICSMGRVMYHTPIKKSHIPVNVIN